MAVADKVVVELQAKLNRYNADVLNAQRRFESSMDRIARSSLRAESIVLRSSTAIKGALGGITGILGIREIAAYADAWTQAGNLIRASATAAGVGVRSLNELKGGANEARTSLETYTELYARLIRSASGVAKSEEEIALATNLVAKAMKAGGASAQEQAASLIQLGQALGSGVLQGDELRSLRENAPVIAKAIADEFNVSIAGLKKLGEEGKLTSERVFRAIINAQKPIEAQFKATNATIRDAITQVNNEFMAYIGNADASAGASARLVQALQYVADNFKEVADVVVSFATVLIAAFTGKAIGGLIVGLGNAVAALGAFLTAVRTGIPLVASFSAALGPIGLLAGAAAGAIYLLYNNMSSGERAAKSFSDSVEGNETALNKAASASRAYQVELAKQISLQLEAAKAAYAQASADADVAETRASSFRKMTGLRFAPLEYAADTAASNSVALAGAVDKLEAQEKRAQEILSKSPSGYGGGIENPADNQKKSRKKTPAERFDDDIQRIADRTAALIAETEAQRQLNPLIDDYGFAMEKARVEQELLNAAQKAGVAITPQLRAEIAQTAEQFAIATVEAGQLAEAQDKIRQRAEEWQDAQKDAMRGIVDDLIAGKSAAEAFASALDKIISKLLDMAFDDIFTGIFKSSGGGGILGFLGRKDGGVVKAASGGYIRGAGGPRTDSIPAMLSNGEYVVNAAATKKFKPLLDRINSGGLALAAGGGVGLRAPTMPVLQPQRQASAGGAMRVDVGVSVDEKGNLVAYVKDIARYESKQEIGRYDKGGAYRFKRDSREASRRGIV